MSDPGLALQKALLHRLTEPGVISCKVFDCVPEKTRLPYVVMDTEISSNATPISGKKRENRLFYLSVWSNYKGQAVSVRVLRTETNREPDGKTYMGSVVLSILTQH